MYNKETDNHWNRNRIISKVNEYPDEDLQRRLDDLRQRVNMLNGQWSASGGDNLAKRRTHLSNCIKVASFEMSQIERRIKKKTG